MSDTTSPPAQLMRALVDGDGGGRRALAGATLRAVVDVLIAGHSRGAPGDALAIDIALASELAGLADEASARTVSDQIIAAGLPLPALVEALLQRGGGAALALVARLPALGAAWRQKALLADDPRLAAAMAARSDLTDAEQDALAHRGETAVMAALAGNGNIRLTRAALQHLLAAGRNRDIARALLARSDLDAATLLPLYRFADAETRAAMRTAIAERAALRGITLKHPHATPDDIEQLLDAAMDGIEPLIAGVAALCGRSADFAEALRTDRERDLMALALVALDVAPETAVRLILRAGDDLARDSRRIMATVKILRETPRTVAIAILAAQWPRGVTHDTGSGTDRTKPAPVHLPAMAPGGTTARDPAGGAASRPRRGAAATVDALKTRS